MFEFAEVGGAVRDQLLGKKSKDVDFVAIPPVEFSNSNTSIETVFRTLVTYLKSEGFKVFLETPEFFTVRAQVPDNHPLKERTNVADFVLARKDGPSSDGRRPDYVLPGTLMDDLQRRDFTMNAIAVLNGEFIDPFGGQKDIEQKLIRFVGDPNERIAEDGLRVMRALRFMVTTGFDMEEETWQAIFNSDIALEMLSKVSVERIREELEKMFFTNTIQSIDILYANDLILSAVFRDGLRLQPTLKKTF